MQPETYPVTTEKPLIEKVGQYAVDNALPIAGGVAGGIITAGSPAGIAVGAGLGRGLQEETENILGVQSNGVPKSQGRILGESMLEGVGTYIGGKVLDKTLPVIGTQLSKMADAFANKETFNNGIRFTKSLSNFASNIFRDVPSNQKAKFIQEQAGRLEEKFGIPSVATERAFERGFDKTLKPENVYPFIKGSSVNQISQKSINNVASITDDLLGKISNEYETSLGNSLRDKTLYNANDIASSIREKLMKLGTPVEKDTRFIPRLEPSKDINSPAKNVLNRLIESYNNLMPNANKVKLKDLHDFKRDINTALNNSSVRDNSTIKNTILSIKNDVTGFANQINPQYKAVNDMYYDYITMSDSLVGLDSKSKALQLIKGYFNPDNTNLRNTVDDYVGKAGSDAIKKWNDALDEETARYFVSTVKKGGRGAGLNIPNTPFQVSTPRIFSETAKKRGMQLVKQTQSGTPEYNIPAQVVVGATNAMAGGAMNNIFDQLNR